MTSISHVVLVSWTSGEQIHAEELVRPSVRGLVGTIPGVLAVVEGHSTSPEGLEDGYQDGLIVTFATPEARDGYLTTRSPLGRRGDWRGRRADRRLRHLTQPGSHLLTTRTNQTLDPAHGSLPCKPTPHRAFARGP